MRKTILVEALAAMALAGALSCSKPVDGNIMPDGFRRFIEVDMPSEPVKVSAGEVVGDKVPLCWSKGDQIAVVENLGQPDQKTSFYQLVEGDGTKNGKFEYLSGDAATDVIIDVLYPASSVNVRAVPPIQKYRRGTFDTSSIRLAYHNETGGNDDPIILKGECAVLSFFLTGTSPSGSGLDEKLVSVSMKSQTGTYSVKIPEEKLGSLPVFCSLVVPEIRNEAVDITFEVKCGESLQIMKKHLPSRTFNKGVFYKFRELPFHMTSEWKELKLAFYNVAVFSRNLPEDPRSEGHIATVAAMMKEKQVDAMLLAELDRNNKRHDYDQLSVFAAKMGWNSNFAKACNYGGDLTHWKAEYGIGAAYDKKYRLQQTFNLTFSKYGQEKEDRVCQVLEFEHFVLVGTHLPLFQENSLSAAKKLTAELKSRYYGKDKPVFFCGDMNSKPSDATILELKKDWTSISPEEYTCPASAPTKCLDYIFALKGTGNYEVLASEVCRFFNSGDVKQISDHLPLFAHLRYQIATAETQENKGNASLDDLMIIEEVW